MTRRPVAVLFLIAVTTVTCGKRDEAAPAEPLTLSVTHWTDATELFMEYPPLVTGHSARFAVHVTTLKDFKALSAGRASAEFAPERGGAPTVFAATEPLRPGAFRVEGVPPAAGTYRWAILVDGPGVKDRHDLGTVTVFADEAAAIADAEKRQADDPSAFAYLKEQQWTNEFATAHVREAELRTSIRVPAAIEPLTGGEAVVGAPAAGRFTANALPSLGATVQAGQTLGSPAAVLSRYSARKVIVPSERLQCPRAPGTRASKSNGIDSAYSCGQLAAV